MEVEKLEIARYCIDNCFRRVLLWRDVEKGVVTKSKVGIKKELSVFYGRITVYLYTSKSIFFLKSGLIEREKQWRKKKEEFLEWCTWEGQRGSLSESICSVWITKTMARLCTSPGGFIRLSIYLYSCCGLLPWKNAKQHWQTEKVHGIKFRGDTGASFQKSSCKEVTQAAFNSYSKSCGMCNVTRIAHQRLSAQAFYWGLVM